MRYILNQGMAGIAENQKGHSDEEWEELKKFMVEIVKAHTDPRFIDKIAKALDEDVFNNFRVQNLIKYH